MKPTSIQIIDSNKDQADLIHSLLTSMGYEVEIIYEPRDAFSRLEQNAPDLIILDEKVKGLTPQTFLEELVQHDSDAFLIVTFSESSPGDCVNWVINGAFAFLQKPVDPARLRGIIEKGLENKEAYHQVVTMARDLKKANADLEKEKRALKDKTDQLRFLFNLSSELSSTLESGRIMETVASEAGRLVNADLICFYTRFSQDEPPRMHADRPLSSQTAQGLANELAIKAADAPQSIPQVKVEAPLYPSREKASKPRHTITFPLVAAGRTCGLLGVYFNQKPVLEPDKIMLLENLALQSAQALFNAHQHEAALNLAVHDSLTGLINRRGFDNILSREFDRFRRYGSDLSLITMDLDHFKSVNDRYGHEAGDEVLRMTAKLIKTCIRSSDVPARIGGEEFAVLLPNTRKNMAIKLARRIQRAFRSTPLSIAGGVNLIQTVSQGVADTESGSVLSPDDLKRLSDQAMYRAKRNGRDTIEETAEQVIYSSEKVKAHVWT